ncbi:M60 family metallopeptidase [Sphingobacterium sp. ML3W]|uniref:M60 family metallopeptidase n=1 Tax=Sphingobacterium sp. ML3W TaxID=1538644 RepID=UPI00068DEFEE|nr:M60 family metallopeptidase [Sphingobacterium sp. ML3W]
MNLKSYIILIALSIFFVQCKNNPFEIDEPIPVKYEPGIPDEIEGDSLIKIVSGTASSFQQGEGIELSFDGDLKTIYHSPWSGSKLPITLEFNFGEPQDIDYLVYKPRTNSNNGLIGEFELWYLADGSSEYTKVGDYDFQQQARVATITFSDVIKDVQSFKFVVKTGYNNFVSCAEMEFYQKGAGIEGLSEIFADETCSELKAGVGQLQINAMKNSFFKAIAQSLHHKNYPGEFRIQEYQAYPSVQSTAKSLKIGQYNPFENPTGIYFSAGSEVVILVGDTKGEEVSLKVHDFDSHADGSYNLKMGLNKVKITNDGLGYISFYTDNYKTALPVKIHIPSAEVNGYFDKSKHNREDWTKLLNASVAGFFDIKGEYVNLAYSTPELKLYCDDGLALINFYDEVVKMEFDIMGLTKYNKIPKNHMFGRTVESGLFADGWGAAFARNTMKELANPEVLKTKGIWAIAHEFGHVNQIRPGLKWVGTTEVTNNIYSVMLRYHFTPNNLNLEQERVNDGDNNHVLGGRFNSFLNYGVVKGEQWQCQKGQDKMTGYENGGDPFVKLSPIWQLLLYYDIAEGTSWRKQGWYADVAEIVRNSNESNLSNGQLQLNFMKNVCDIVQEDLTDFFVKVGMLKPIDKLIEDYTKAQLTITQADCDQLIQYAKKYNKPKSPVVYYLTANSLDAYQKQLSVIGNFNQGVTMQMDKGYGYIDHNVWKNVAVFETYKGDELVKVAMVGTDSPDKSSTLVRYPQDATRIEAVAWNGDRTLVYGNR